MLGIGTVIERVHGWIFHRRINPILLKEVRATFQGNRFFARHLVLLFLCAAALCFVAVGVSRHDRDPARVGRELFLAMQVAQLLIIGLIIPAFSATSITSEREAMTHELLLATGLRASSIVWGKFLHTMTIAVVVLTSFLPFVATVFFYGGVASTQLIRNSIFLLVAAAFAGSYSLAFSALANRSQIAVIASYLWTFIVAMIAAGVMDGAQGHYGNLPFLSEYGFAPPALEEARNDPMYYGYGYLPTLTWKLLYVYLAPLFCLGSIFAFSMLVAINSLKPSFANRTTNMKIFYSVFIIGGLALLTVCHRYDRDGVSVDFVVTYFVLVMILATLSTRFAMADLRVPLHIRQRIDRLRGIKSPIRIFFPGCSNGGLFCVVINGIVLIASWFSLYFLGMPINVQYGWGVVTQCAAIAFAWMLFCATLGMFLSLVFFRRPRLRTIVFFIVIIVLTVAPLIHHGLASRQVEKSAFDFALSPVIAIIAAAQRGNVYGYQEFSSNITISFVGFYLVVSLILSVLFSRWSARIARAAAIPH